MSMDLVGRASTSYSKTVESIAGTGSEVLSSDITVGQFGGFLLQVLMDDGQAGDAAPDAEIKLYKGTTGSGTLLQTYAVGPAYGNNDLSQILIDIPEPLETQYHIGVNTAAGTTAYIVAWGYGGRSAEPGYASPDNTAFTRKVTVTCST